MVGRVNAAVPAVPDAAGEGEAEDEGAEPVASAAELTGAADELTGAADEPAAPADEPATPVEELVIAAASDPAEDVAVDVDCWEHPARSIAVVAAAATTRFFLCSVSVPP